MQNQEKSRNVTLCQTHVQYFLTLDEIIQNLAAEKFYFSLVWEIKCLKNSVYEHLKSALANELGYEECQAIKDAADRVKYCLEQVRELQK